MYENSYSYIILATACLWRSKDNFRRWFSELNSGCRTWSKHSLSTIPSNQPHFLIVTTTSYCGLETLLFMLYCLICLIITHTCDAVKLCFIYCLLFIVSNNIKQLLLCMHYNCQNPIVFKYYMGSWVWWCTPSLFPVQRRQRHEDLWVWGEPHLHSSRIARITNRDLVWKIIKKNPAIYIYLLFVWHTQLQIFLDLDVCIQMFICFSQSLRFINL